MLPQNFTRRAAGGERSWGTSIFSSYLQVTFRFKKKRNRVEKMLPFLDFPTDTKHVRPLPARAALSVSLAFCSLSHALSHPDYQPNALYQQQQQHSVQSNVLRNKYIYQHENGGPSPSIPRLYVLRGRAGGVVGNGLSQVRQICEGDVLYCTEPQVLLAALKRVQRAHASSHHDKLAYGTRRRGSKRTLEEEEQYE